MDGKNSTTTLDGFERALAKGREALRRSKEASAAAQTAQTHHDKKWQERQLEELKEVKESRRQTRERMADVHKVWMGIFSRLEAEGTDSAKELRRSSVQAKLRNKGGRPKGKGSEDLRKRNEFIAAKKRLALKSPKICGQLDVAGFATPEGWPSTWVESYRKDVYRERIYSIFADAVKKFG